MDKYGDLKMNISGYQGVVFDLDETLVDLGVDWIGLKKRLAEVTERETGARIEFTPLDQRVSEMRERYGDIFFRNLLEIISEYEMKESTYVVNEELVAILESLEGRKIAIYSMNTKRSVDNFVSQYLRRKPDIIISKDDCLEPKPTGKDLDRILKEWKLSPEEVVYIGNSDKDKISGELAGIRTYIISIN
jgi:HAD superfamily hydrolase (TIGR01549 family)